MIGMTTSPRHWTDLLPECHVRAMWPGDLSQVLRIEHVCFPHEHWWESADFARCFALNRRNLGCVAEMDGRLVGFIMAYAIDPWILKIDNLAVLPAVRRRGVARRMLEEIEVGSAYCRPRYLRAIIRERNLAAQLFFKAVGWRAVGLLKKPWPDCEEDGIKFFKRVLSKK